MREQSSLLPLENVVEALPNPGAHSVSFRVIPDSSRLSRIMRNYRGLCGFHWHFWAVAERSGNGCKLKNFVPRALCPASARKGTPFHCSGFPYLLYLSRSTETARDVFPRGNEKREGRPMKETVENWRLSGVFGDRDGLGPT